jgi:putative transposase
VPVSTVVGDELVGVAGEVPDGPDLVAVGERVPLAGLPESFRTAAVVLDGAERLGRTGVVTLADLGWRLAAVRSPEVGRLLTARYRDPLEGPFGALVAESVRAYLAADRNVPRAARSIPVHANTLRYRLRRFEELTGRSLESTDTIIEAAFVLGIGD